MAKANRRIRERLRRHQGGDAKFQVSCYGKGRYSHDEAKALAKRDLRGRKAYRCEFCNSWHIGRTTNA